VSLVATKSIFPGLRRRRPHPAWPERSAGNPSRSATPPPRLARGGGVAFQGRAENPAEHSESGLKAGVARSDKIDKSGLRRRRPHPAWPERSAGNPFRSATPCRGASAIYHCRSMNTRRGELRFALFMWSQCKALPQSIIADPWTQGGANSDSPCSCGANAKRSGINHCRSMNIGGSECGASDSESHIIATRITHGRRQSACSAAMSSSI
jgi:hypothetical protein